MSRARPGLVTAAAVITLIEAVILILGFVLVVAAGTALRGGGVGVGVGVVFLIIGAVYIWGGVGILRGSNAARLVVGVLAAIGILLGIYSIARGSGASIISIALDAFLVYVLLVDRNTRATSGAPGSGAVPAAARGRGDRIP